MRLLPSEVDSIAELNEIRFCVIERGGVRHIFMFNQNWIPRSMAAKALEAIADGIPIYAGKFTRETNELFFYPNAFEQPAPNNDDSIAAEIMKLLRKGAPA